MMPTPSSVKRAEDMDAKTAKTNELIADIVPMIDDLDSQALRELHAYLEAKIKTEKKDLEKKSTKVITKGTPLQKKS